MIPGRERFRAELRGSGITAKVRVVTLVRWRRWALVVLAQDTRQARGAAMSEVYEYRVSWQHPRHPDWRDSDGWIFRSDEPMWVEWTPTPEPVDGSLYDGVPNGIEGIVEASRREAVRAGHKGIRVERRQVTRWEVAIAPSSDHHATPDESGRWVSE